MPQPRTGDRRGDGRGEGSTKESFQRLASAELPALYWLARRLVRDGAEDLVQEALLRAYRSYGTLRQDTAAGPWLKSILVNVFRDQLRRQARSPEELPVDQVEDFSLYQTLVEQDLLPYSDTLHHDYLRAFAKEDVREVLLRLPGAVPGPAGAAVHGRLRDQGDRRPARCPLGDGPGPAASGSQAVRAGAVDLRPGDRTPPQGDSQMTEHQAVIPCSEAVRQLWDYLDQAVSPEEQEKVEQHLSFCRSCCGSWSSPTNCEDSWPPKERTSSPARQGPA